MRAETAPGSQREATAPSRRAADKDVRRARGRFLPVYFVWAALLPVGLVQAWFAFARRAIAYELPNIENQTRLVRSDIEKYHIEAESLKAMSHVAMVAQQLGFDRPATQPIVLPPTVGDVAVGGVAPKPGAVTAGNPVKPTESETKAVTQEAGVLPTRIPMAHRSGETETVSENNR
jgi:hypothetical protein